MDSTKAKHEKTSFLNRSTKIAYGISGFGESIISDVVNNAILVFYNTILMVPITWVGWAFVGTRLWDAVSDPLMGYISDNTRSRWGRRRPYILVGGIGFALSFCAICIPPTGMDKTGLFVYLALMTFLFYTGYTIMAIPMAAFGAELTPDYHERTQLFAYRTLFSRIGNLLSVSALFIASQFPSFRLGFVAIGVVFGILGFTSFIWTTFGTRENINITSEKREPILKEIKMTISNKPFLMLSAMMFFFMLAINVGFPAGSYITI